MSGRRARAFHWGVAVRSSLLRSLAQLVGAAVLVAIATPQRAVADLAAQARTLVGPEQGVYVEAADGSVLVAQAADRAVHPASVSKVATTLALLRKLGGDHRFATRFSAGGPLHDGVLAGDLIVEGSGDPFLVDENAVLVLLALRGTGLRHVDGNLVARGPLFFDWETGGAAGRLQQALAGHIPPAAWIAVRDALTRYSGTIAKQPAIAFGGAHVASAAEPTLLVTHLSEPLIPLVKALNGYSNNIFSLFAESAGGVAAVQAVARESVPAAMRDEIVLGDGAGENPRNRLSPRAAVALLRALDQELAREQKTLADVLPVAGIDEGTLRHRLDGPGERGRLVGKTGTYGDYGASALAGAIRTRDRGVVYFAVLNHNVPIDAARRRQDAFARALLAAFDTEPWPYQRDEVPAFARAEVVAAEP